MKIEKDLYKYMIFFLIELYCLYIIFSGRQFSTSLTVRADENKDYEVNPTFVNRNPRLIIT